MKFHIILLFISTIINVSLLAQHEGCTDSTANNFNPDAVINDGSCTYNELIFKPEVVIRKLPTVISESSGLIWWNDSYYTHNDSDSKNELYRLDAKNGKVIQTVTIHNAINIDWEEITHDDSHIFIGDFGNNYGNRTNLCIYKINKHDLYTLSDTAINAEVIQFKYGDQNDFSIRNLSNDFDCEAMISFGDSLYLFSKNWKSQTSRIYSIPKVVGNYTINPLEEFNVNGLITGAAIDTSTMNIVLCGYKNYYPFSWILSDFKGSSFFRGNKRRVEFRNLFGTQTEAVASTINNIFFISSEKTPVNKAKLFKFDLSLIK